MKKAISVTLNRAIFQIEEDAYIRLDEYFKSIKNHYQVEEGNEIIFDIEASIAEKFNQKISGDIKIVTLKDVEEVIAVMGSVNQFDDYQEGSESGGAKSSSTNNGSTAGGSSSFASTAEQFRAKKLFRNPDDVILGGVCSGIGLYFNVDPLFFRIIFILLTLFGGSGVIIYLILWIIVPKAANSAQILEMRGKPVNLEEIQELAREKASNLKEEGKHIIENVKNKKGGLYEILNFPIKLLEMIFLAIKKVLEVLFPVIGVVIGLALLFGFLVAIIGLTVTAGLLLFNINSPYIVSDIPLTEISQSVYYYVGIISTYLLILVPFILLVTLGISLIKRKNSFARISAIGLTAVWVIAAAGLAVSAVNLAPKINQFIVANNQQPGISRDYDIKGFTKLNLQGNGLNVSVVQGPEYRVQVNGNESNLNNLLVEAPNGELVIRKNVRNFRGQWCIFCWQKNVNVTIVMPALDTLSVSSYANVEMSGFTNDININLEGYSDLKWNNLSLPFESYNVRLNLDSYSNLEASNLNIKQINISQGSYSDATITGRADVLNLDTTNYSELNSQEFIVKDAIIDASNYSDVLISVSDNLSIEASNYSKVEYFGEPNILNLSESNFANIIKR